MSRLFGYFCSDDTLTHAVMSAVEDEFGPRDEEDLAGLGIGWLQEGRSLLRKQPHQGPTSVDVGGVLSDIPARTIIGHAHPPVESRLETLDLQPFRFRRWVYAQEGLETDEHDFDEVREALIEEIPDHIRRNIQGNTFSEVCFHRFLAKLQDHGIFNVSQSRARLAAQALRETVLEIEERIGSQRGEEARAFPADVVTASERLLLAVRNDQPMHYRFFDGIEEAEEEPLFAGHNPQKTEHPHFNAILVSTGIEEPGEAWEELPKRHVLWVNGSWDVNVVPFEELE